MNKEIVSSWDQNPGLNHKPTDYFEAEMTQRAEVKRVKPSLLIFGRRRGTSKFSAQLRFLATMKLLKVHLRM